MIHREERQEREGEKKGTLSGLCALGGSKKITL
jgi:hypothetical protein